MIHIILFIFGTMVIGLSMAQTRTILVTGSTDGIGKEAATELASNPENFVIIHGRNMTRCKNAVQEIKAAIPNSRVDYVVADFAHLQSVNNMVFEVQQRFPRLNVLVNNAGVMMEDRRLTQDGLEMTFQVNHLAHFLLATKLLPLLKQNRPSRLVVVSSGLYSRYPIDWTDLQAEKAYDGWTQYSRSKMMNTLFAFAVARRFLKDQEIAAGSMTANVMEPGGVDTKLAGGPKSQYDKESLRRGAATVVYLAQSPNVEGVNGEFFNRMKQKMRASEASRNETSQQRLWQVSEKLLRDLRVL